MNSSARANSWQWQWRRQLIVNMKGPIVIKSKEFAVEIVKLTGKIENKKFFSISNQILKSGTSIGANVSEAQSAHSKRDFITKMEIALKEAQETDYWLEICNEAKIIDESDFKKLVIMLEELRKLLISIIKTTKSKYLNS